MRFLIKLIIINSYSFKLAILFLKLDKILKEEYNIVVGWANAQIICEESPSITEQSRLITSSQGDLRKSATERYRQNLVRVKR